MPKKPPSKTSFFLLRAGVANSVQQHLKSAYLTGFLSIPKRQKNTEKRGLFFKNLGGTSVIFWGSFWSILCHFGGCLCQMCQSEKNDENPRHCWLFKHLGKKMKQKMQKMQKTQKPASLLAFFNLAQNFGTKKIWHKNFSQNAKDAKTRATAGFLTLAQKSTKGTKEKIKKHKNKNFRFFATKNASERVHLHGLL